MSLALYRLATVLGAPLVGLWLSRRRAAGKEEAARQGERTGRADRARPPGELIWLHAASVGESVSALPLIERLLNTRTAEGEVVVSAAHHPGVVGFTPVLIKPRVEPITTFGGLYVREIYVVCGQRKPVDGALMVRYVNSPDAISPPRLIKTPADEGSDRQKKRDRASNPPPPPARFLVIHIAPDRCLTAAAPQDELGQNRFPVSVDPFESD